MPHFFIVAGEASGDLHGANLIASLKKQSPNSTFTGFGGEKMQDKGLNLIKHYSEIAVMGFFQVLLKLRTIKKSMDFCKDEILKSKPDAVILIDFPGFNLKMAEFAKKNGIKVFYYIAPKVWASRPKRVEKIKAYCDKVFSILPFELEFFAKHNVDVTYIGNPLLDEISAWKPDFEEEEFRKHNGLSDKPLVALLAGSRKNEIKYNLPQMLELSKLYPNHEFVLAGVPILDKMLYEELLQGYNVKVLYNETYSILKYAEVAIVTSGTATLETCILNTPQVVSFAAPGGRFTYWLLMTFVVNVKYISLVNLMLNKEVVKEFLQMNSTVENLKGELDNILFNKDYLNKMLSNYSEIHKRLGKPGASSKAASEILKSV